MPPEPESAPFNWLAVCATLLPVLLVALGFAAFSPRGYLLGAPLGVGMVAAVILPPWTALLLAAVLPGTHGAGRDPSLLARAAAFGGVVCLGPGCVLSLILEARHHTYPAAWLPEAFVIVCSASVLAVGGYLLLASLRRRPPDEEAAQ